MNLFHSPSPFLLITALREILNLQRYRSVCASRNLNLRFFDVTHLARSFLSHFTLFSKREKGPHELEMIRDFESACFVGPNVLPVFGLSCMSSRADEKAEDPWHDVEGTNKMRSWRGENDSRKRVSSGDIESWMSRRRQIARSKQLLYRLLIVFLF